MLSNLLKITRPLIVCDVETTGTAPGSRIIQLGFQVHRPDGVIDEWKSLVNPGMKIPPAITKITGITDAMMAGCRVCGRFQAQHTAEDAHGRCEGFKSIPTFAQIAPRLVKGFTDCDFAGKNIRFDLERLSEEFSRTSTHWSYAGARILCADALERILEPRDLSSLYRRRVGKEPIDAHDALADVRMTTGLIEVQLSLLNGKTLDDLHEQSWPGFLDAGGKFRLRDGEGVVMFGKHREQKMSSVPADYWRWLVRSEFPADVKSIAERALRGEFPPYQKETT